MWYAAMAQLVEHILGKDEVPGPNPGSSSRQPRREIFGALAFLWDFRGTSEGSAFFCWGCLELLLALCTWLCGIATESGPHTKRRSGKLVCRLRVQVYSL